MSQHPISRWFLLGSFLLVTGCATKIAGLKASPTFTHSAIESGKFAVGGVVSAHSTLDEGRRSSLAGLLRTAILEERKDYNVIPAGTLMNRLGSQYAVLASEIQSAGELSEKSLQNLKNKASGIRYVAFARIENDDVSNDRNETASTDRDGKLIPGSEKVVTRAERTVSVSLHIYDLKSSEVAWGGTVTKSLSATQQFEKEKELGLVSVIKAIKGDGANQSIDQKYPFPTAPDSQKVLARVFAGFAENLPEKD